MFSLWKNRMKLRKTINATLIAGAMIAVGEMITQRAWPYTPHNPRQQWRNLESRTRELAIKNPQYLQNLAQSLEREAVNNRSAGNGQNLTSAKDYSHEWTVRAMKSNIVHRKIADEFMGMMMAYSNIHEPRGDSIAEQAVNDAKSIISDSKVMQDFLKRRFPQYNEGDCKTAAIVSLCALAARAGRAVVEGKIDSYEFELVTGMYFPAKSAKPYGHVWILAEGMKIDNLADNSDANYTGLVGSKIVVKGKKDERGVLNANLSSTPIIYALPQENIK